MKQVKLKRQNSVPNRQSTEMTAVQQTYEKGVDLLAGTGKMTEKYKRQLIEIVQNTD